MNQSVNQPEKDKEALYQSMKVNVMDKMLDKSSHNP